MKITDNKNKLKFQKMQIPKKIIKVGDIEIGKYPVIIAGPCAVESEEQLIEIAKKVKESGAHILRGGAYKPRSSPTSFQGLEDEGLKLLKIASKITNMPIITEVMHDSKIELIDKYSDIFQVGSRSMQSFGLLKELAYFTRNSKKPILLKRGMNATLSELLNSAKYLMMHGNDNIILCLRGIRTFEQIEKNSMRFTPDLGSILLLKEQTNLPIIFDPSHPAGSPKFIPKLSQAAILMGADGLMIEVHNNPSQALCDGNQSLTPNEFKELIKKNGELYAKI